MARRIIGIVLSVVLAVAGTLVLVIYVQTAERRALAGEETVNVLVVREEVSRGTPADALADRVELETIPVKVQAAGSVDSLDQLSGTVASVALLPGEQVTTARFVSPEHVGAIEVPAGLLQVSVQLSPERAIGGNVRPGDHVGVLASFSSNAAGDDEETTGSPTTHLTLHKVLVSNVQGSGGGATLDGADTGGQQAGGNLLVTLAIDAPSVERVVFAAEHGSIWLSAEPEDAPEEGTRIQRLETIYQ